MEPSLTRQPVCIEISSRAKGVRGRELVVVLSSSFSRFDQVHSFSPQLGTWIHATYGSEKCVGDESDANLKFLDFFFYTIQKSFFSRSWRCWYFGTETKLWIERSASTKWIAWHRNIISFFFYLFSSFSLLDHYWNDFSFILTWFFSGFSFPRFWVCTLGLGDSSRTHLFGDSDISTSLLSLFLHPVRTFRSVRGTKDHSVNSWKSKVACSCR